MNTRLLALTIAVAATAAVLMTSDTAESEPADHRIPQPNVPYVGEIKLVPYNFAPRGWADCDGQLVPISGYTELFSVIGTTYGGDGRTTFALPDMRGRCAIHAGKRPDNVVINLGAKGGGHKVAADEDSEITCQPFLGVRYVIALHGTMPEWERN